MRPYTNAYLRGAQGYFLKNFKKVRKSQVAGIEKIVVVGVSGMFRGRGVVTDRHRSTSRILRNRCSPVVDVGLVGEVFPVARRRVELLHGQRVFRCGLPHARRHVVLVVARVSAVAVRRVRVQVFGYWKRNQSHTLSDLSRLQRVRQAMINGEDLEAVEAQLEEEL